MEFLNLPLSEDPLKRRHSCLITNQTFRIINDVTTCQLSRRNSTTDVDDYKRNSLELKSHDDYKRNSLELKPHRACFAVANVDGGNKCIAKIQLTLEDAQHIHL